MQKNHLVPKNCVMRSAPCISVPPKYKIGAQRSGSDFDDGPSGAIRTRGFQLPKLAPYRLGYTRKYEILAFVLLLYHARRCGQACGHKPFFQRNAGKGKPPRPQQNKGLPGFASSPPNRLRTRSQSWRPTNWATPGNAQYLIFCSQSWRPSRSRTSSLPALATKSPPEILLNASHHLAA